MIKNLLIAMMLIAVVPPSAQACPICDQETGRQVRAGIFDQDFGFNLFVTALPFGIFLGIIAAIHFGLPRGRAATLRPVHEPTDNA